MLQYAAVYSSVFPCHNVFPLSFRGCGRVACASESRTYYILFRSSMPSHGRFDNELQTQSSKNPTSPTSQWYIDGFREILHSTGTQVFPEVLWLLGNSIVTLLDRRLATIFAKGISKPRTPVKINKPQPWLLGTLVAQRCSLLLNDAWRRFFMIFLHVELSRLECNMHSALLWFIMHIYICI